MEWFRALFAMLGHLDVSESLNRTHGRNGSMVAEQIAVLLADGFEEIEAVTVIDVLRRAELDVTVVGVGEDMGVEGAHGLQVAVEMEISDIDASDFGLVVLPGGMPGSKNLAENEAVCAFVREVYANDGYVAAICAAPIALQAAGVLKGRKVTSYPSFKSKLKGVTYTENSVEVDERIITSRGPGTAFAFALTLVETMASPAVAAKLRSAMLIEQ